METTQLALLSTRRFLPLFLTQFLGAFNDNVFKNALVILITYRLAEAAGLNAQILVTLAAGIFILPFFIFSATAGQLADKYEKSRLISIIKFVEIILMVLATIGFYLQNVYLLILVLFSLGTHAAFFGPLKYAILPDHLRNDELIAGNGLIEAGTFIAILMGTIFGGLLILRLHGDFLISAAVLIIAISGWCTSLFVPKTPCDDRTLPIRYNIVKETCQILQYMKKQGNLFLPALGISWFWLVGATFLSEFPVFGKDILHTNENVVTLFLTLFSVGMAIGSLLCNKLLKGKIDATYVPLGALGMTVFMVDLYFAATHSTLFPVNELATITQFLGDFNGWRISLDLVLIAVCGGIYTVPLYAILQYRTEKAHRARVIAGNNVMNALFMVLASIAIMLMLKFGFSVTEIFLTVAIANAAVALYACKLLPDIIIRGIFRAILLILYRVKITGLENYKNAGNRVIIIANHTSFIDALLLAIFLPDNLTFAINTIAAKKWWTRYFLNFVDAFPIDPTNPMAIKSLIHFVQQDKRCVIFPEGRLTMTGALMKIYEGPGLIADRAGATLLPIRIEGAERTPFSRLHGKVRIQWMPTITITLFPPQTLEIAADLKGRKRRQKIGYKLYDVMTEVMFENCDYHKTLFASLLDAKSTHGARHEIMEDVKREPVHYQKFITNCFVLGGVIAKETQPGEHVGILLPNMVGSVTTFFALQAFYRVPAMLNYSTGALNILTACQTANIQTVYTSRKFITLAKLTDTVIELEKANITLVYLEDLPSTIRFTDKLKGFLLAQAPWLAYQYIIPSHSSRHLKNADSTAVILFTSGSEGTPKGVVLSHQNIQANRYQLSACVDFGASDKIFNALPIFHAFGLTGGMLLPLLSGVRVFFYPSPLHYRIVSELSYDTNATILFGTDTFLAGYAKHAHPYDFYSVRYVFAGAEKLRNETRALWSQKFGVRILEGYGTTETSPVIATNTPMQNKVGTVGRFLPGIRYRLNPVPGIDAGGVLTLSGPNVMKGYLLADQPGVLVPPVGGWYNTGDVVAIDDAGFVTIIGRVKRFAKIAGEMVSLTMVEQCINLLWPAFQHAVLAIQDAKKGERLVLMTTNPNAARDDVISHARDHRMADIAIPRKIIVIPKMPLLGTGKTDYTSLKTHLATLATEEDDL